MADISKISPDDGSTILNIKDSNAVHYGEQSKGYVGKNKLKLSISTHTVNGVTFTINTDKSVTINGTATRTTAETIGTVTGLSGNYRVSEITGGSSTTYNIQLQDKTTGTWMSEIYDGSKTFTLDPSHTYGFVIVIRSGKTVSNVLIKPMIMDASITDTTYEPYLTPNTEIPDKMSYADNAVLGAKNFFINSETSRTVSLVEMTVNADDSIAVNGTSNDYVWYSFSKRQKYAKGKYKITGCPQGGSATTYRLWVKDETTGAGLGTDSGDGLILEITDTLATHEISTYIAMNPSVQADNLTFYPMMRLASDTDDTYAPHAMTNRELTEEIIITPTKTSALSSISSNTSKVITGHKLAIINFTGVVDTFSNWGAVANGLPKPTADVAINVFNRTTGKQNSGVINTNGECQIVGQSSGEYPTSGNAILISATYTYSSLT